MQLLSRVSVRKISSPARCPTLGIRQTPGNAKQPTTNNQLAPRLEPEAVKDIAALNVPLLATTRQRTRAVNKILLVNTEHAHLRHRADECEIPCALAKCEGVKRQHGKRVLSNVLVRGKGVRRLAALGLGEVLVVPCADSSVKFLRLVGSGDALLSSCVSAEEGGEIDRGEALGF